MVREFTGVSPVSHSGQPHLPFRRAPSWGWVDRTVWRTGRDERPQGHNSVGSGGPETPSCSLGEEGQEGGLHLCEYDCPFSFDSGSPDIRPRGRPANSMSLKEVGLMAGGHTQRGPYRPLKAQKGKRPLKAPVAPRAPGPEEEDPRVSGGRHVL